MRCVHVPKGLGVLEDLDQTDEREQIPIQCICCGHEHLFILDAEVVDAYDQGCDEYGVPDDPDKTLRMLLEAGVPSDETDILITGTCHNCWEHV